MQGPRTASADAAAGAVVTSVDPETGAPVAPPAYAGAQAGPEYDAWRAQHEAWRAEHRAWKRSEADANREAREQWRAEQREQSRALAAEAAERRRVRRLERPRTSLAFVAVALGAAMLAGAAAAVAVPDAALAAGLSAAAAVGGVSMVVAGLARRRAGFLSFVSVLLLVGALGSMLTPVRGLPLWPDTNISLDARRTGEYSQAAGTLWLWAASDRARDTDLTIHKASGETRIELREGSALELDGAFGSVDVQLVRWGPDLEVLEEQVLLSADGDASTTEFVRTVVGPVSGSATTVGTLHLDQHRGTVTIDIFETTGDVATGDASREDDQ
ncbi:hypothetical protein [Agromyces mangrovi Wang et al. 2018]|uniref:hypothetical protein n=1 Tax=Agromyces mangrovi TaxID=1858653 RepID=UPI002573A33C|nr:hypothetical protein [Agromyces mangrovi]BDZ65120.1 hypothetical protein GCM10025877_20580 [Agromyces mangrovi]